MTTAFTAAVLALPALAVFTQNSRDPIVIPVHNWFSQIVMSNVIGQILETDGNNLKYVIIDSHLPAAKQDEWCDQLEAL